MTEDRYTSATAEIIEASGNFINSIRNPSFVLLVAVLIGFGYLFYRAVDELIDIKVAIAEQNVLVAQQNVLLIQQNKELGKKSQK